MLGKLKEGMDPAFRLFITALPNDEFPLGLLQMCTKVCVLGVEAHGSNPKASLGRLNLWFFKNVRRVVPPPQCVCVCVCAV